MEGREREGEWDGGKRERERKSWREGGREVTVGRGGVSSCFSLMIFP